MATGKSWTSVQHLIWDVKFLRLRRCFFATGMPLLLLSSNRRGGRGETDLVRRVESPSSFERFELLFLLALSLLMTIVRTHLAVSQQSRSDASKAG